MTVICACGYKPKNYADLIRHLSLLAKRGSYENHWANTTEWDIEICPNCGYGRSKTPRGKGIV